jgi:hypothetical protein
VQSSQAPPIPHTVSLVPGWHIVPSQHPELQGDPGFVQAVPHLLFMQDWPAGQSNALLHSEQVPPLKQVGTAGGDPQALQVPPLGPHSGAVLPCSQVPEFVSQQPWLHCPAAVQAVVHVVPLQLL